MHCEDVVDFHMYEEFLPQVEKEWEARFADPKHDGLSVSPAFLNENSLGELNVSTATEPAQTEALEADAKNFKKAYLCDVQFVFSRVQHHVHKLTKKGYVLLRACMPKGGKQKTTRCRNEMERDRRRGSKSRNEGAIEAEDD